LIFPEADADKTTDNCKNEHPAGQGNSQSQGGFGGNRFAALGNNNNQGGTGNRSGAFGSSTFAPSSLLFAVVRCLAAQQCNFFQLVSTSSLQQLHFNTLAHGYRHHALPCDRHMALRYPAQALLLFDSYCS
jgi:hypothetical protein